MQEQLHSDHKKHNNQSQYFWPLIHYTLTVYLLLSAPEREQKYFFAIEKIGHVRHQNGSYKKLRLTGGAKGLELLWYYYKYI